MARVEVERQRDESPEQLAPDLGDDPLPDHAEQVRLQEASRGLHEEQPDQGDDQAIEPGRVAAGNDLGRDPGDDQREGQPDGRRDDEADERERERPPMRPQVGEQPRPRNAPEAAHLTDDGPGVRRDPGELLGHGRDDVMGSRNTPSAVCGRLWAAGEREVDRDVEPDVDGDRDEQ